MQFYTDPTRENDPHALPDAETFYHAPQRAHYAAGAIAEGADIMFAGPAEPGWYWWPCFPGCLPDSDPIGPFATEAEAIADAREVTL